MSDDEEVTPAQLDDMITNTHSDLLETNAQVVATTRAQILNLEVIKQAYLLQAARIDDLIKLHAAGAAAITQLTGDLILAEFGFERADDDEEEDEGDE